jgi:pimeloyl-ACP methyl ester carboxylesterase
MPDMPTVEANGITLEYDWFGDESAPAILLIMGLGTQMIAWPENFCQSIADQGFRVIRYDNRDVGLSTKFEGEKPPGFLKLRLRSALGLKLKVPYTLNDMAGDAVGLMDSLGIERAHVVGASMGGMIAQLVAADYPQRTLSLTSIMSTTGHKKIPGPRRDVARHMFLSRPKGDSPEALLEHSVKTYRLIESPGYRSSDEELRAKVQASLSRTFYPPGFFRHISAIAANGSRAEVITKITAPTLVIHGAEDPLVPLEGGKDTAERIAGARLEIIEGMGHDLAPGLVPKLADLISGHASSVTAQLEEEV